MKLDKKTIILIVIYLFTILVVLYLSDVYKNSLKTNNSTFYNDITSSKYNIIYDNVYNYSLEHSDFRIYVSDKYVVSNNEDLFLNSETVSSKNLNKLIFDFGYSFNINKGSVPFYIVFKDGKIKEIVHD